MAGGSRAANLKGLYPKLYRIQNKRLKLALIIDDSLVIRRVIDRALTKIGFEVKHAEDGMKGLKAMKVTLFDLVLCDFLMPIMDGLDCVQQYRQWERRHRTEYQQVRLHFDSKLFVSKN